MSKHLDKFGLSYKQFLFCESFLQNFNADEAARLHYKGNHKNGTNILKSRKVRDYLFYRLEQKRNTIETLTDKAYAVLGELMDSTEDVKIEAVKQVIRLNEVINKLKEIENNSENTGATIHFNIVERKDEQNG